MSELLEILSPVGDMERLYAALDFGADAVYLGGTCFGMRAASANFDAQSLAKACKITHEKGKKLYHGASILVDAIDGTVYYFDYTY